MSEEKKGFFRRLREGLTKTRDNIVAGIDSIFSGFSSIDDDFYEEIEEILVLSNEELEEINLYLLNQREHAIALYSQQLYGMKRTANRLSNTSTSFQDQLQHMN